MIEILKSIGNGIVTVIQYLFSFINNGINVIKVFLKVSLWSDQWLYLLPPFFGGLALVFLVIFVVNRFFSFNGRN